MSVHCYTIYWGGLLYRTYIEFRLPKDFDTECDQLTSYQVDTLTAYTSSTYILKVYHLSELYMLLLNHTSTNTFVITLAVIILIIPYIT